MKNLARRSRRLKTNLSKVKSWDDRKVKPNVLRRKTSIDCKVSDIELPPISYVQEMGGSSHLSGAFYTVYGSTFGTRRVCW